MSKMNVLFYPCDFLRTKNESVKKDINQRPCKTNQFDKTNIDDSCTFPWNCKKRGIQNHRAGRPRKILEGQRKMGATRKEDEKWARAIIFIEISRKKETQSCINHFSSKNKNRKNIVV